MWRWELPPILKLFDCRSVKMIQTEKLFLVDYGSLHLYLTELLEKHKIAYTY